MQDHRRSPADEDYLVNPAQGGGIGAALSGTIVLIKRAARAAARVLRRS